MIHGKDSNIKQRMILCTLVLLFPAQTNVDLVHFLDSLSELLNAQPIIIHLIFMFLLPITSNTGGNQDTLDWRGRVPMYSNDLWLEGKSLEMRRKSSVGGLGVDPACGASEPVLPLLKKLQVDLYPHARAAHGSYDCSTFK